MFRAFILAIFSLSCCSATIAAEPAEFSGGIEFAQARLVKIYGASIGRSPGYGTGILISADGDILTSYGSFLTSDAVRVTLPNGDQHFAKLVRSDTNLQAAIIKIDAKISQFYDLNEATSSEGGDWVLALSNAFKVAEGTEPLSVNLGVFTTRSRLDARRGAQDFPYTGEVLLYDAQSRRSWGSGN
jgi:serine protease Do